MSTAGKKGELANKHGRSSVPLQLAAIGMEAEFQVTVDGELVRPEDVFGDPRVGSMIGPRALQTEVSA